MKCPRCNAENTRVLVTSPVGNEWEVYICDTCIFTWRSTEGENIINPDRYDARFKLNSEEFDQLDRIPPIPALKG